jgi:pimeloyl-ACP methyl ester carboxylesterase
MSDITKESLIKSFLNKKSKIPKQFHHLHDIIPFPIHEVAVANKGDLVHYSLHNWNKTISDPTILLHGLNGSRLLFTEFIEVAEQHYTSLPLIAPDLFGHGLSSCPSSGKYNIDLFVDQIVFLLNHLGIDSASKINVVGFSLGGAIAVGFARRFPERIGKLVLISPAGFVPFQKKKKSSSCCNPEGSPHSSLRTDMDEEVPTGISSHVRLIKYIPSFMLNPLLKSMFKSAFTRPQPALPPTVPDHIRAEHKSQTDRLVWQSFIKKGTIEATLSIVKNFPLFNMEKEYAAVHAGVVGRERPVLLIWGERDGINPIKTAGEKVKGFFDNSFLLRVEDSGHVVLNEQPNLVISSIVSFLHSPSDFKFYK